MRRITRSSFVVTIACGAMAITGCSTQATNGGGSTGSSQVNPSSAAAVDDGGCTKNHDKIAQLQAELNKNLYGVAATRSGKDMVKNPNPVPASKKIKITFSLEGLSHPMLTTLKAEAQSEAKKLNASVNVVSGNDDTNKQFNDIQTAISQGTDALLIEPATTAGLDAVLAQAAAKRIPYFFTLKGMLGVQPINQVLAPYANEGKKLGQWVVKHYKGKSSINVIVISGIPGDQSSVARVDSFEIELLKACNFNIVATQPGQYRRQESQQAASNMLVAHKNVQLLFGANDEAALGGLAAMEAQHRTGIDIVGLDGEPEMFSAIRQGKALATVVQYPTAKISIDEIVDYMRGKPVPSFKVREEPLVTKAAIEAGTVKPPF